MVSLVEELQRISRKIICEENVLKIKNRFKSKSSKDGFKKRIFFQFRKINQNKEKKLNQHKKVNIKCSNVRQKHGKICSLKSKTRKMNIEIGFFII